MFRALPFPLADISWVALTKRGIGYEKHCCCHWPLPGSRLNGRRRKSVSSHRGAARGQHWRQRRDYFSGQLHVRRAPLNSQVVEMDVNRDGAMDRRTIATYSYDQEGNRV